MCHILENLLRPDEALAALQSVTARSKACAVVKAGCCVVLAALLVSGCASSYDYTNFRAHRPRSIVVLPPLNESTDVNGTYGYLSTATMPLAEMGYYVFPIAEVDELFKENGMPTAGEMHQAPLSKIREIIGADAVLYITLKAYGTKYQIINSATVVRAEARLVDTATGTLLWQGQLFAEEDSASGNLIGDLVSAALDQMINKSTDRAHSLCRAANGGFGVKEQGLLYGPYHPGFEGR
ncbi:MAG TPA: GNA1162 family protein [Candidatus Dormibacteraeota bacterium]|nr:GNA1162 family protein [Candidatus Dormibacteraeota bacterium]